MVNKLKIVFVGTPDMAFVCLSELLEKKFNIVCTIPPHRTHPTYNSFVDYCKNKNLNIIDFEKTPNEKETIEKIKKLNADIGVVCSYNFKLSKEFLASTKMGYINCHPSLLPKYRGAIPYFHIIKNGEKQSGITLHFMDENFDTGDIIYQKTLDILPWENMGTLFNRTNFMIAEGLAKVLSGIEKGVKLKRIPQVKDNIYITAPKTDGNLKIRWNKPVDEISCLIRACNPFYNALTSFRNTQVKIIKASPVKIEHNLKFGQIAKADEKNLFIACQGGFLSVEILQLSTWGIFNVSEFYYTFTPLEDEFFE